MDIQRTNTVFSDEKQKELKKQGYDLANAFGYDVTVPGLNAINVADGYCIGYTHGYNSRDEEVALLVTVLRRLYKDSMATDFNEHWDSYETATNLLHKYPQ